MWENRVMHIWVGLYMWENRYRQFKDKRWDRTCGKMFPLALLETPSSPLLYNDFALLQNGFQFIVLLQFSVHGNCIRFIFCSHMFFIPQNMHNLCVLVYTFFWMNFLGPLFSRFYQNFFIHLTIEKKTNLCFVDI